jgi:hypothetical protein
MSCRRRTTSVSWASKVREGSWSGRSSLQQAAAEVEPGRVRDRFQSRSSPDLAVRPLDRTQQKKKLLPESLTRLQQGFGGGPGSSQGLSRNIPPFGHYRLPTSRASFARHYRPGALVGKSAERPTTGLLKGIKKGSGRRKGEARILGWGGLALTE